jgi:hypothetical protein
MESSVIRYCEIVGWLSDKIYRPTILCQFHRLRRSSRNLLLKATMRAPDVLESPAVPLQSSESTEPDLHPTPCCVTNLMSNRNPCSDPTCSSDYPSSHHVTSQCTDQCVVITCNDSDHLQNSCNSYDSSCNNPSDCQDCGGFEDFVSQDLGSLASKH